MKIILSNRLYETPLNAIVLLVVYFITTMAQAQTSVQVDFLDTKSTIKEFQLSRKDKIQLKISNINRNLYNITVDGKINTFNGTPPAIFGAITSPDLTKIATSSALVAARAVAHNNLGSLRFNSTSADKVHIVKYLAVDKNLTDNSIGLIEVNNKLISNLKLVKVFVTQVDKLGMDGCKSYKSIDSLKSIYFSALRSKLSLGAIDIGQLQTEVDDYFDKLKTTNDKIQSDFVDMNTEFAVISNIEEKVEGKKNDDLKKAKPKDAIALQDSIDVLKNNFAMEKVHFEALSGIITDCKTAYTMAADWKDKDFTGTLKSTYEKINPKNFEYISPSLRAGGDQLEMTVSITDKDATQNNCSLNTNRLNGSYLYDVYGFKVDFSTGLFANMGSDIFDQTYRLDSIPGDKKNNVIHKNDNKNTIVPSLGALMHIYHKFKNGPGLGGNFGLSITNQTKLNYHAGVSFLFGNQQRIILSGGVVLTQAQLISDQYKVDAPVDKSVTSIPTSSFFRWGSFISLTWNLTSSQKSDK